MRQHKKPLKALVFFNVLSIFFIALTIFSPAGAGYGFIILVPIIWPTWALTVIGDLLFLPLFARSIVGNQKHDGSLRLLYAILLIAALLVLSYFIHRQFTFQ